MRYSLGVLSVRRPHGNFVSFSANVNDGAADVSAVRTETLTNETQQLQERHSFNQTLTMKELKQETVQPQPVGLRVKIYNYFMLFPKITAVC